MTLDDLRTGEKGRVVRLEATGPFKKRLLEMGFVAGAEVEVIRYAPLKDPVEFRVKGYHVSLRHEEAARIVVEPA
ncbi:ferrous iron transport protein A [Dissulfurirhabdus thermomarina]|uniref:Ferrous iron transport protein A n=1 Tax=Dissulfurirhabdus thermomarina TaxID=1765737 RepID=A0A6N9TN03_DISTH|nr:ferrous iron transport protein A [Dissulfurirhabdus thermomarina]NDY42671.1 ferrous iron transport protein A [Dissulfurirhabdus thermomarina]NMX23725.1 ferrous iron transport protein A [Dissulfurirhabdus thermomarina]